MAEKQQSDTSNEENDTIQIVSAMEQEKLNESESEDQDDNTSENKEGSKDTDNQDEKEEESGTSKDGDKESQEESESESGSDEDDDHDDDNDSEDDKEEANSSKKPKKKGRGISRRIKRFNKRLSEKDAEIEFLRRQLEEKNKSSEHSDDKTSEGNKSAKNIPENFYFNEPEPDPDEYDSQTEYIRDVARWEYRREKAKDDFEAKQKTEAEKAKNNFEKQAKSFREKCLEFSKEQEDFEETIEELDDYIINPALQNALFDSDLGPQVLYELAQNFDELERVNSLSERGAFKAVGALEAKLSLKKESSSTEKDVNKTKAPAPPNHRTGAKGRTVKKSLNDPNLTQAEFEALYKEKYG